MGIKSNLDFYAEYVSGATSWRICRYDPEKGFAFRGASECS